MISQLRTWQRLVAEGVVIVAGVLIALGADRWMQQLDARELEREYLEQLLDDFIQVDSILQRSAADWERRQEQAEVVLAAIDGTLPSTVDARRLALSIGLSHWLFSPPLPRETWQDLIATGRTGLIASEGLRRSITDFYLQDDLYSDFYEDWVDFTMPYRRSIYPMISPELQLAIAQFRIDGVPVPDELIPQRSELLADVRSNEAIRATIGEVLTTNWAGAGQQARLSVRAGEIIETLTTELGGVGSR